MQEVNDTNFDIEVLKTDKVTIVDFWAEWCGPCRMLGPIFEDASKSLPEVKFVKLNVDNAPKVAAKYGIMSIPTMMVFKKGERIDQMVGVVQKDKLVASLKKHI